MLEDSAPDYVLKAAEVEEKGEKLLAAYTKLGVNVSLGDAANLLYSDYSEAHGNRAALMASVVSLYQSVGNSLMSWPNAYALPYADYVANVPMTSSNLSLADETVPYYAGVVQGHVAFSGNAVNLSDEPRAAFLHALETGGDLAFILVAKNTEELRFSKSSELYACRYADWADEIISMQNKLMAARQSLGGATFVSREMVGDLVTLTCNNGAVLMLNYCIV